MIETVGTSSWKPIACLALGLLAAVAGGCRSSGANKAGGAAPGKPLVLRLADPDIGQRDLQEFVRSTDALSDGSIRIEVRGGWRTTELDYDRGTLADVRTGKVALAKIAVRSLDTLGVTEFQPLVAPLLIDSLPLERATLSGAIPARILPALRRLGVVGVAVLPGAIRRPFGRSRTLVSPAAFRGMTFGVRPSLVAAATVRALGAKPHVYVPGRLPKALDGAELEPTFIEEGRLDDPGTSLARNVGLWPRVLVVVANTKVWQSLTRDQRDLLRRAGRSALDPATGRLAREERDQTTILCRRRQLALVAASDAQLAALRRAVQPVYQQMRREPDEEALLEQIVTLKDRLRTAAAGVPTCGNLGAIAQTGARTEIDGVYRVTTTAHDLRAAGAPESEVIPENYGTWTYVLDRGRFADTQESEGACTWGYGKFTVTGHETAWTFIEGGGIAPNRAYNKPGEFFRFDWSLYHDVLTLSALKGAASPANFRAKPWRRITTSPSQRYFSKRCPPPAKALAAPR
jgi:TRAP-type C4-dicarboxylate transport system substrate-binding protein